MSPQTSRTVTRERAIREFYLHLGIYLSVMLGLFIINYAASPGTWWFLYAAGGWGIGLGIHGVTVFVGEDRDAIDRISARDKPMDGHLRSHGPLKPRHHHH